MQTIPDLCLAVLLLLPLTVSLAQATTYEIAPGGSDSNACTSGSPCATYNHVRPMLQSGDTLYFRAGTYYGGIGASGQEPLASGLSPSQPTTVAGYPGETVVLLGDGGIGLAYYPPKMGLLQHVTFKNFLIDAHGSHALLSILGCVSLPADQTDFSCGPHFIRFEDIEIKDSAANGVGCGNGASDIEFIRLKVHGNGSVSRGNHGWYIGCARMTIDETETYNNSGYGIHIFESYTVACVPNCANGSILRNSYIHDNHTAQREGEVAIWQGADIQVYNNVIVSSDGNVGISANNNTSRIKIWNNTIVMQTGSPAIDLFAFGSPGDGAVVQNNILHLSNNPINVANATGVTMDHNLCSVGAPGCSVGNPAFAGSGPQPYAITAGSDAQDAGIPLSAFATDKMGGARGAGGAWDRGAYEYGASGAPPRQPKPPTPRNLRVVTTP